jgi:gas vesicle protein
MSIFTRLLTGLAVGAAGMYFFDPQQGKRRRALLRDQWTHLKTQTPKRMESKMRHFQNQAQGLMHEFQGGLGETGEKQNPAEGVESQASRMQSAARGASADAGEGAFSRQAAGSTDGEMHQRGQDSTSSPGEAGERAPSRQPNTRQTMDL